MGGTPRFFACPSHLLQPPLVHLAASRGAGAGSELLLAHGLAGAEAQRGRGAEKLEVGKFIVAPTEFVAGVSRQLARN